MSEAAPPLDLAPPSGVGSALRRLSAYIARHPVYYGAWLVSTLLYVAGFVAVPRLVGWSIAGVTEGLGEAVVRERVGWLVLVTAAAALVRYYSRTLVFNAAREIEYELRNDIYAHLQRLPQSFYYRWRTGDLMSRCVNDINAVRLLMGVGLLNIIQTPVLYVAVIIAMVTMNAKLALLVLLPYPIFVLIARLLGRTIHHWSLLSMEGLAEASNQLQETISGIAVVKAYAMEGVTAARFEDVNQELYRRQLGMVRANAAMPAIVGLLPAMSMCIILYVGGGDILAGRMDKPDFFAFSLYVFQLTFPTFIMGWVVALVQRGAASMQRIDELLSVEPSIADDDRTLPIDTLRGEIEIRGLSFSFGAEDGRADALREIDLHVPAGSTLGVVGTVGSGKSTLAALIPRVFEVPEGRLFIDGNDVNRIPLETLRGSIAVVPQESFLFSATLAENIAFGRPDATREEIEQAARRAQLAKDVADLPRGYATLVGERGVMLSGGQRQRTALARALMLDPAILILDDTLSAVDAETESAIQRELQQVFAGRTVVIVSSRVSAVRGADQVVVLDEGRIVERGTHDALLAARGLYARLAQEQEQAEEEPVTEALAEGRS